MASSSSNANLRWVELPLEITALILVKIGANEILSTAQYVCTTWRRVCQDATMWRSVDLRGTFRRDYDFFLLSKAVELSQGQLLHLTLQTFYTTSLRPVSPRCTQLRSLQLLSCTYDRTLYAVVKNFPVLEELVLHDTDANEDIIAQAGRSCPHLKSLKLDFRSVRVTDVEAQVIAESMPQLRQLQLINCTRLTTEGLRYILDGCSRLESLDLRKCSNDCLGEDLETICSERIKELMRPDDPLDGYDFEQDAYKDHARFVANWYYNHAINDYAPDASHATTYPSYLSYGSSYGYVPLHSNYRVNGYDPDATTYPYYPSYGSASQRPNYLMDGYAYFYGSVSQRRNDLKWWTWQ